MYAFINGTVSDIKPGYIVLNNNNIGYLIIVPNPYQYKINQEYKVYTYHYVREEINNLYGFLSEEAKDLFIRLIGVSGIGPKSALSILATDSINDVILAIEEGNVKQLTKFPGIGTKSAQQIILDLKGKLVEDPQLIPISKTMTDAELALQALGYNKKEIGKVLKKIDESLPVETIIKQALKLLSK